MRLDNHSQELSPGRLFIHGQLNDPMTGGPLYCRILSFDAAWVEYEPIYHREDGSERLGSPRRLPIEGFLEETFGGWYQGTWPPPAILRAPRGLPVPVDPRTIGERPAGSCPADLLAFLRAAECGPIAGLLLDEVRVVGGISRAAR